MAKTRQRTERIKIHPRRQNSLSWLTFTRPVFALIHNLLSRPIWGILVEHVNMVECLLFRVIDVFLTREQGRVTN